MPSVSGVWPAAAVVNALECRKFGLRWYVRLYGLIAVLMGAAALMILVRDWDHKTLVLEIVETNPVMKSATKTASTKPAKLENGVSILVPPHIEAGTRVVVMTADGSYVERAKGWA